MKITKRQLRRIIKEEKSRLIEIGFGSMEPFAPDYDTRDTLDDFDPIQLSYTNPQTGEAVSKPLYSSGEADDAFDLMFSIDPNIKYSVDDIREGKCNIKTTRQQLRRIVREYKSVSFPQRGGDPLAMARELETIFYNLDDMLSGLTDDGVIGEVEMNKELLASVISRLGGKKLS